MTNQHQTLASSRKLSIGRKAAYGMLVSVIGFLGLESLLVLAGFESSPLDPDPYVVFELVEGNLDREQAWTSAVEPMSDGRRTLASRASRSSVSTLVGMFPDRRKRA